MRPAATTDRAWLTSRAVVPHLFPHKGGPDTAPGVSLRPRLPMPDSQTLGLIIAASVAAVLLFRLYTVLGRRTGHEPQPAARPQQPSGEAPALAAVPSDPVARGLMDIQFADRNFDRNQFLQGARTAYDMIQKAFANGDRLALRPLLSGDVFAAFEQAIATRSGPPAETLA